MAEKIENRESEPEKSVAVEREMDGGDDEPVVKYRGWKSMPYVIGNETFEKLGTLGTLSNLLVYLTTIFHMESVAAATLLQIFHGTTNLAPILGAFLSDTYLGRYSTLAYASVASFLGMFILSLTAAFKTLHPPSCSNAAQCQGPSPLQLATLFLSFLFLAIGAGGIRPCNLAFGADQFDPRTESGRRGINSFFNWYYFTFTVAMMISSTVIIYVQSNISWAIGLAIPAMLMFFACVFFFIGTSLYVRVRPEGSPFSNVARVLVAACSKRNLKASDYEGESRSFFNPPIVDRGTIRSKLPHTDQFRFLDKASIMTTQDEIKPDGLASNPWRLCTLQHVEEVKCIARILPIWLSGMIYSIGLSQHGTYIVFQALQFNRHLGKTNFQIPAGSFVVFNMLALTIWIPIYDRIIVPRLQKTTKIEGGMSLLHRMGIGIFISVIALLVAAIIEERRRQTAVGEFAFISSMSSLWLIPQLALFGISEAFCIIGQIELFYKQFPENMRSVAGSFFFLGMAISSYLCSLMVMIVHRTTGGKEKNSWLDGDLNKGRLDLFYFLNAAIAMINLLYFIMSAKWYKYKPKNSEKVEISMKTNRFSEQNLV